MVIRCILCEACEKLRLLTEEIDEVSAFVPYPSARIRTVTGTFLVRSTYIEHVVGICLILTMLHDSGLPGTGM